MRAVLDQATHSLSMTFQLGVMAWSWCSDWTWVPQSEPPMPM